MNTNNNLENTIRAMLDSLDYVLENNRDSLTALSLVLEKNFFTQPERQEGVYDIIKLYFPPDVDNYTLDEAFLALIKTKLLEYFCNNQFPRPEVIFALSRFYGDDEVLNIIIENIKFRKANNKEIIFATLMKFDTKHISRHKQFLQSLREFPDPEIVARANKVLKRIDNLEAMGLLDRPC